MLCEKHPLKVTRNPTVLQKVQYNVVKGNVRFIKLAVELASGVELPAGHDTVSQHTKEVRRRAVPFGTVR